MNTKRSVLQRLSQYTAASASFLMMHKNAEAIVIPREIDPDSVITSNDTILLDIDENGTNDIMFWIESHAGSITTAEGAIAHYSYRFARASALGYNVILGKASTSSGFVFQNAYRFLSGDEIGDTLPYFADDAFLAAGIYTSNGGTLTYSYAGGPWNDSEGDFLGIRFIIDGYNHYAWIRLKVGAGASEIAVQELAYDNVADIPITAGTTASFENLQGNDKPHVYTSGTDIHIELPDINTDILYQLTDISGRKISDGSLLQSSSVLHCSGYPAGIYLLRIFDGKSTFTERIFLGGR